MSDTPVKQNWLVSPTAKIEQMWADIQIQERVSRITKMKQDIEDLLKIQKVKLEAQILMLEMEVEKLQNKKTAVTVDQDETEDRDNLI